MTTSTVSRVFNFSAGPATLPLSVLEQIQNDLLSLPNVGASVLEISHRSKDFDEILEDATTRITQLANIPDTHEVLFLQGGSALQNAMMPMNFITDPSQTETISSRELGAKKVRPKFLALAISTSLLMGPIQDTTVSQLRTNLI